MTYPKHAAEPLLTAREVADLLRIKHRTLYKWRAAGVLPPVVLPGGGLRWKRGDVERVMQGQEGKV